MSKKKWDWTVEYGGMTIEGNGPRPALEELDSMAEKFSMELINALNKALAPRR